MALRDLSKKRRGWRWELYKNRQGKIPKELLELFVDVLRKARPNELPANPPLPVLTEAETETLRQNLNYISRFGPTPNLYGSEADSHDLRSPVIVKVKGDKYEGVKELKISNTPNNPRFLIAECANRRVFFLHGFLKKSQDLKQEDKELARRRLRELRDGGECT